MQVTVTLSRAHKIVERLKSEAARLLEEADKDFSFFHVDKSTLTTIEIVNSEKAQIEDRQRSGQIKLADHLEVQTVISTIRRAVGKANVAYGVDDLMAEQVLIASQIRALQQISSRYNRGAITGDMLPKYLTQATTQTSYGDTIAVNVVTAERAAEYAAAVAKLQQQAYILSDKVSDANANKVTFDIPDRLAVMVGVS